jgi:hypothetical protein
MTVCRLGQRPSDDAAHATLQEAQRFYYNGDYDEAAAVTPVPGSERPDDLDACELRTASLHFQIKKALGEAGQRGNKTTACSRVTSRITASCASFSPRTVRRRS